MSPSVLVEMNEMDMAVVGLALTRFLRDTTFRRETFLAEYRPHAPGLTDARLTAMRVSALRFVERMEDLLLASEQPDCGDPLCPAHEGQRAFGRPRVEIREP
jgi:hypothetical protein